jgi:hypothetical protein
MDMKTIDIIWQAGIIDGDGTITITKQKGRKAPWYRAFICVVNSNLDILVPFTNTWGGKIHNNKVRERKGWKPSYTWVCPTANMPLFLESVGQYMRTKSELTTLAIKILEHKTKTKHKELSEDELEYREALYLRSLELNRKGRHNNDK